MPGKRPQQNLLRVALVGGYRQAMGRCFYCNRPMSRPRRTGFNRRVPDEETLEHIYPRGVEVPQRLIDWSARVGIVVRGLRVNQAYVCHECNGSKGSMHPLEWLAYCPTADGAHRLSQRLLEMGEDREKVAAALRARATLLSGGAPGTAPPAPPPE